MLINIRVSELQSYTRNTILLAIIITITLNFALFNLLPYDVAILSNNSYMNNTLHEESINIHEFTYFNNYGGVEYNSIFSSVSSSMWDGYLAETGHITSIGSVMYTNYNMWLLMSSLILLLAMVGVLVIVFNPFVSNSNNEET